MSEAVDSLESYRGDSGWSLSDQTPVTSGCVPGTVRVIDSRYRLELTAAIGNTDKDDFTTIETEEDPVRYDRVEVADGRTTPDDFAEFQQQHPLDSLGWTKSHEPSSPRFRPPPAREEVKEASFETRRQVVEAQNLRVEVVRSGSAAPPGSRAAPGPPSAGRRPVSSDC
jgi:hypothetical protein